MGTPSTAILVPSLGRARHMRRVWGNIEQNTPEPHVQIWCVGEPDYFEIMNESLSDADNFMWLNDTDSRDKRYVTRMNKLARAAVALEADFIFFGSDDVVHHPFWLANALKVFEDVEEAQVVVVNDLRNPNGTQAVIRTGYLSLAVFDNPGAAFHHGYNHNFADTEMFLTAAERGVIYRAMDSHVEHLHPLHQGANQRQWDQTYADAQAKWDVDATHFHERMVLMKEALHGQDALSR